MKDLLSERHQLDVQMFAILAQTLPFPWGDFHFWIGNLQTLAAGMTLDPFLPTSITILHK